MIAQIAAQDATTGFAAAVIATGNALHTKEMGAVNTATGALLTRAAADAGGNGSDQTNLYGSGLHLVIDITAITGTTPTYTVTIEGKDPTSGKYYPILASAALTAVGTTVLRVYPGFTAAANLTANDALPLTWRVKDAIGGTTPAVTATVAATVLP